MNGWQNAPAGNRDAPVGNRDAYMPRRPLGRTGFHAPLLGFGTAPTGYRRGIREAAELFNAAIDAGVNYFDTAPNNTGYGLAQQQLAAALKDRRKDVFLATKCHTVDGDAALRLLDRNLKELRTDYADLVYVHSLGALDPDDVMDKRGILPALVKAREQGKLRHIGLSGHSRPSHFVRVLKSEWADQIAVIMNAVNFADRYTYDFEGKVWPLAAKRGVALVAMKVFAGMQYDRGGFSNSVMPKEHHDLALRYALSLPNVACAVIGMAIEDELKQNIARVRAFKPLTPEETADLRDKGRALADDWGPHFGPTG